VDLSRLRAGVGIDMAAVTMMAIAHDWLEPTETKDASETQFIDRVLEGWAAWARNTGIDLRPTSAGDLWQISTMIEARDYVLVMTDDAFVIVDQQVARLPRRLRLVVTVEYQDSRSSDQKAKGVGLNRLAYRQRLHAAQWSLFTALLPSLDGWRQELYTSAQPQNNHPAKVVI
jgi:hypothetical protein